jgi:hypothetical protein
MSQPYFGQVWGWSPTLGKSEDLESSGTPECSELDSKAQNTSHWGVLGVIEKVLKRRCRKWPRIGHLDICSPSYGQKKGRESNCQFDSRPLKVGNRPFLDLRIESAIRRWKDLDASYKFGSGLVAIRRRSQELWAPKVPRLRPGQFRDNFGTPGKKWHSGVGAAESHRVYYREYGGGILLRSGPWCVSWSKVPVACPNTQGCPGMWTNHVGGLFWCIFKLDLLVPLPSLISGLPTWPSTPF